VCHNVSTSANAAAITMALQLRGGRLPAAHSTPAIANETE
jgi:hypothetical protein